MEKKKVFNRQRGTKNNPLGEGLYTEPKSPLINCPIDTTAIEKQLRELLIDDRIDIYIDRFTSGTTIGIEGSRADGEKVLYWSSDFIKDSPLDETTLSYIKRMIDEAIGDLDMFQKSFKNRSIREGKLSDKQLQDIVYKIKSDRKKSHPEVNESVVHMTDEEHFNPIVTAESLKVGDEVYDDKSGHKCRVIDVDMCSKYHRNITFLDTETEKEFIRQVGNLALFEVSVDGDTSYEVEDDIEVEWHPIDDYFN